MLLGLDIGGSKIAGVLLDETGQVVERHWSAHTARGPEAVADAITGAARRLLGFDAGTGPGAASAHSGPLAVGVSVSGLIATTGRVTRAAVLQISDDDLAGRIGAALGCPVVVVNDADATLVAASASDPDGPVTDAVLLALGTGVGGAVLSGGRLLQGPVGYAGELGHLPVVDPLAYPCVCGSSGCLEQLAGGRGLVERAASLPAGASAELAAVAGVELAALTAVHVVAAARQGQPDAVRIVSEAAQAVGHALALLSLICEPAVIYLGGSLAHAAADLLLDEATARLHRQLPFADVRPLPRIRLDDLGPTAAAVGAARLAGRQLLSPTTSPTEPSSTDPSGTEPSGTDPSATDH